MKAQGIRLVPIIDAGVKIEDGYDVYEEGVKNGYFCTNQDGSPPLWPVCGRAGCISLICSTPKPAPGLQQVQVPAEPGH